MGEEQSVWKSCLYLNVRPLPLVSHLPLLFHLLSLSHPQLALILSHLLLRGPSVEARVAAHVGHWAHVGLRAHCEIVICRGEYSLRHKKISPCEV